MNKPSDKFVEAYHRMMEHTQDALKNSIDEAAPQIKKMIDNAVEHTVEVSELTKEEAKKVGDYLRRDLDDATDYMYTTKKELSDWFRFDVELVEDRVKDWFTIITDTTRSTLDSLAENAELAEWHTGEITSPGTLRCDECEHDLHFHKVGHIPPCPNCTSTKFHRVRE